MRNTIVALALLAAACPGRIDRPTAVASTLTESPLVGQPVQLDGSASADPQGRPLAYAWSFAALPVGSRTTMNDPAVVNPSFTPDVPGDYVVELVVGNGVVESTPASVTVTVTPCGAAPPVPSASADPAMPNTGQVVQLSVTVDDPDNDECMLSPKQTFAYEWSFLALPAGSLATLNQPTSATPSFVPDVAGLYTLEVTVTDSAGFTGRATRDVDVSTCGNARPVIDGIEADPDAPMTGETVQLSAPNLTDADNEPGCGLGQALFYDWAIIALPLGSIAALNDASARNPSFTPDQPGDYVIDLVVTDSTGRASDPDSITVTADVCGSQSPVVDPIVVTPTDPITGDVVLLEVTATDPDNDLACDLGQSLS